ncbi:hypothetical protein IBL26_00140 [Roseomonas aerophila]|uniref:Rap1a immunity protein domain-containing protein n=1 Tax=Teichococcus aerophilus TaxID=1224513 RepID=A0ABR7RGJ8_9PROT|nr:hypothetical protein [Pseudoroseomonas aerophila]
MRTRCRHQVWLPAGLFLLSATTALAQPTPETARPRSLGELAAICGTPAGQARQVEALAFCHGYLLGVGDFHAAVFPASARPGPLFCPPTPAPSLMQVTDSLVAWAQANPQYAADRAIDGVARWAKATYPCPPQPAAPPARGGRRNP